MKHITFLLLFFITLLTSSCSSQPSQTRTYELRDSLIVDYMTYVTVFYDSAFIDWDSFTSLGINQYAADWSQEIDKVMDPTWRECDAAALYWDRLQSAKICLHRKSLPLRAIASKGIVKELDTIEQAFDEAFIEMISQEYYMRIFQDVFDEIFSAKVDHLAVTLAKERSK